MHEKSDSLIYILYFRKLPLLFLPYSVFLPPTPGGLQRRTYQSSVPENHISESNQMSQPDFLYELFEDFMDDPVNQDFSMDNGLVCRWMTANLPQAKTHFKRAFKIYEKIWADEPEMIEAKYQEIQELYPQIGFYIGKNLSGLLTK